MKVHELRPAPGSTRRKRRVGRGIAGKGGKTAGRGTKGQGARDTIPLGFEGGQLPLMQRIPKLRGFTNPFRVEYRPVNLAALEEADGDTFDLERFVALGLAKKRDLVKVLGGGEITRSVRIEAHAFSGPAERAVTAAGGTCVIVPLPFGHGRPPARGNALTNR
jgi:large subunit ribosomal protein L15